MTILDELAAHARERVAEAKKNISLEEIKQAAYSMPKGELAFEKALKKDGVSFICECKKASPSKGIIAEAFPYLQIAEEYEAAGADCISVLTEPKWFLGSLDYLKEIAANVSIPCLRKDFTLSALVEAHTEAEVITAVNAGAGIIGVNNRNLKDFSVDTENSRRLRSLIPGDILFVSESGVKTAADVRALCEIGADAVLVGETLMRAENKRQKLEELRGKL